MVEYDPETKSYVEAAKGDRACITVAHWQDPLIKVDFEWERKRFSFDATLVGAGQGARSFRVLSSRFFEPSRGYWVPFIGLTEVVAALRPFVTAWSANAWKGQVTGFEDDRGANGLTLEEALSSPSEAALKELVRKSKERRL